MKETMKQICSLLLLASYSIQTYVYRFQMIFFSFDENIRLTLNYFDLDRPMNNPTIVLKEMSLLLTLKWSLNQTVRMSRGTFSSQTLNLFSPAASVSCKDYYFFVKWKYVESLLGILAHHSMNTRGRDFTIGTPLCQTIAAFTAMAQSTSLTQSLTQSIMKINAWALRPQLAGEFPVSFTWKENMATIQT